MRYLVFILILFAGCLSKDHSEKKIFTKFFPATLDSSFSLNKLKENKATAIVFLFPECPLCQSYSLTLNDISRKYKESRIEMLGVVTGVDFSFEEIKSFVDSFDVNFPVILDKEKLLEKEFKATITPEVFLVNSSLEILYSGRINNWAFDIGQKRSVITEHDLVDAIEAIQNNCPIKVRKTQAIGCLIE